MLLLSFHGRWIVPDTWCLPACWKGRWQLSPWFGLSIRQSPVARHLKTSLFQWSLPPAQLNFALSFKRVSWGRVPALPPAIGNFYWLDPGTVSSLSQDTKVFLWPFPQPWWVLASAMGAKAFAALLPSPVVCLPGRRCRQGVYSTICFSLPGLYPKESFRKEPNRDPWRRAFKWGEAEACL